MAAVSCAVFWEMGLGEQHTAACAVLLAADTVAYAPCAEAEVSSGQQRVCALYALEQQYFLSEAAGAIDGELLLADPPDGCSPFVNSQQALRKIVIIDRGKCTFAEKVANAQSAGATAVIIANNQPGEAFSMPGDLSNISFPAVMVAQSDYVGLKAQLGNPAVVKTGACLCLARVVPHVSPAPRQVHVAGVNYTCNEEEETILSLLGMKTSQLNDRASIVRLLGGGITASGPYRRWICLSPSHKSPRS